MNNISRRGSRVYIRARGLEEHRFAGPEWRRTIRMAHRMKRLFLKVLLAFALFPAFPGIGWGQANGKGTGPQDLIQISSIGESLRNAGQRPLHILYVHGIGATGSGDSWIFQKHICAQMKGCKLPKKLVAQERDYADSGEFDIAAQPPSFKYMGSAVWMTQEEWRASAPFVDHYVLRRSDGGPVVVDEVNWWPLAFPLKCRSIMAQEAHLAGPNKTFLDLCSRFEVDKSHPERFKAYAWITRDELKTLESIRPKGALINRGVKSTLLDWGFSDAMMAVGSMQDLFREGMRQLLVKSARFHADGSKTDEWQQSSKGPQGNDREFVVVTHSLGSYLVFSTLNGDKREGVPPGVPSELGTEQASAKEDAAVEYILRRTSLVYFFANQIPLLELANVQESKATEVLSKRVQKWSDLRQSFREEHAGELESSLKPPQLVAWSDPSDLLTWCIPETKPLTIVNLYVRNTWWHWIFANPENAHENYASNKHVLRMMMNSKASNVKAEACR